MAIPANSSVAFVKSSTDYFVEIVSDMLECDPAEIYYYSPQRNLFRHSPRSSLIYSLFNDQGLL